MIPLLLAVATATTSVFASGGARIHPVSDTAAVRAQAGLTQSIWSQDQYSFVLGIDASFSTAGSSFPEGDVRLFLISGTITAEARHDFSFLSLGIGPRFEIGFGLIDGSASLPDVEEHSGRGLVLTTSLGLSAYVPFVDDFGLSLIAEGGLTIRGLEAIVAEERATGWRGSFVTITLGLWLNL